MQEKGIAVPQHALLEVADLRIEAPGKPPLELVRGVTFRIAESETVGLVGESGSGKSVTAAALMGLHAGLRASGSVRFQGRELLGAAARELRRIRGSEISLVTQDALSALDPVFTVGHQMSEAVRTHRRLPRRQIQDLSVEFLQRAGIPDAELRTHQFPHELSGGMRQRTLLAMGLLNSPALLVADEPTTALDVTIQAQIVRLLAVEASQRKMALLLITHDLRLVSGLCASVIVMYAGAIVETGPADAVYRDASHPYTRALLACGEGLNSPRGSKAYSIPGSAPHPGAPPPGCPFSERCEIAIDRCTAERPPLRQISEGRYAACHLA